MKKFINYLEDKSFLPHESIIKSLDNCNIPFYKNKFYCYNPAYLGAMEFNRCVELYKERAINYHLSDLEYFRSKLIIHEEDLKETLENLAIKIIRKMYGVPEKIIMDAKIKWSNQIPIEGRTNIKEKKEEIIIEPDRLQILNQEIEKRRILNSIVHGSAIYQWDSSFYIIYDELNDLNKELIEIYRPYSALINYYNWQHNFSASERTPQFNVSKINKNSLKVFALQGFNKINFKEKKLIAQGMCLPTLLHEMSKCVLDYIIASGLPNYLSENEFKYVLDKADDYRHEFWHYYLGPTLWRAILETADVESDSKKLPKIISAMAKMDYEALADFCIDITFTSEKKGKNEMYLLKKKLKIDEIRTIEY